MKRGWRWFFLAGWFLGGLLRGWIDRRALDRSKVQAGPVNSPNDTADDLNQAARWWRA